MEKLLQEEIIHTEKLIQDRLRQTSCITIESALRNKVNINVSWYDVHGKEKNQKYALYACSIIEF